MLTSVESLVDGSRMELSIARANSSYMPAEAYYQTCRQVWRAHLSDRMKKALWCRRGRSVPPINVVRGEGRNKWLILPVHPQGQRRCGHSAYISRKPQLETAGTGGSRSNKLDKCRQRPDIRRPEIEGTMVAVCIVSKRFGSWRTNSNTSYLEGAWTGR